MSDVEIGQVYRTPQRHMDDDGRLMVVVAVDDERVTLDCAFKVSSNGAWRMSGARRTTTTVARLTNPRFWTLERRAVTGEQAQP